MDTKRIDIEMSPGISVSGRLTLPQTCRPGITPGLILAHGQNNDLAHPLLASVADYVARAGAAMVLRFNFPYTERGEERPDPGSVLETAYGCAYAALLGNTVCPPGPVFLGGKSLGARIAAELVSRGADAGGVRSAGLVFLGFPLHAPGRKDQPRTEPLRHVAVPSLFITGTQDPFCDLALLKTVTASLAQPGTIHLVEGGDHSLEVRSPGGEARDGAYCEVGARIVAFIEEVVTGRSRCEFPT